MFNNPKKLEEVQKILGIKKEEAMWKRMFTGIKYNNMDVLKKLFADFKKEELEPLIEYCLSKKNQRAADYLKGLDPDAEAEKKRKKQRANQGKK